MIPIFIYPLLTAVSLIVQPAPSGTRVGVLVLAHGGDSLWNRAVEESVIPLRGRWPTEIAFGMARSDSMAAALDRLRERGVQRVAVVGLFVSADSFRHRIEFILGLREDPPSPMSESMGPADRAGAGLEIVLSERGLADDPSIGDLLALRAATAGANPERESVAIVAHGMGAGPANDRLHAAMARLADRMRAGVAFRDVEVFTLQEDWDDQRPASEAAIRQYVIEAREEDGEAIVVPLRLFGFGPYAAVLEGLPYRAATGLLPHPIVSTWMERVAEQAMARAGWTTEASPVAH